MTISTTTLGLLLVAFAAGLLLAWLIGQRRARRVRDDFSVQVARAQSATAARQKELEEARSESQATQAKLQEALDEATRLRSQLGINEAELQEARSSAGEVEDRLNAAEARLLSADALLDQNRTELAQWGRAYGEVRDAHSRLNAEHLDILARQHTLEDELQVRRAELNELTLRLDALHEEQRRGVWTGDEGAHEMELAVTAVARTRADAEAALLRREMDLAEVQSQISAMRYSINVLTAAGAELARRVAEEDVVDYSVTSNEPREVVGRNASAALTVPPPAGDATSEELADLRSIIADWYAELQPHLQFDPNLLLMFGGATMRATRASRVQAGTTVDAAATSGATGETTPELAAEQTGDDAVAAGEDVAVAYGARETGVVATAPALPPALMLAAIKASAVTSLARGLNRRDELTYQLLQSRERYDGLAADVDTWRSMLSTTLRNDPDMLQMLDAQQEASARETLSACATVALAAYQKKQDQLESAAREAPPAAAQTLPSPAPSALARLTDSSLRMLRSLPLRRQTPSGG